MEQVKVLTAPPYEPVKLSEVRKWLRLEDDDSVNDAVLRLLVKAMREDAENLTHRAFIQRTLRLYMDNWPRDPVYGVRIILPFAPLVSVEAFQYMDTSGTMQTLATDRYVVHAEYEPGFIIPAYSVTWPTIRRDPGALQIDFTAGYAPGSPQDEAGYQEAVPAQLKLWMEAKIATHNEFREMVIAGTIVNKMPRDHTDGLLDALTMGSRIA